MKLCRPTDDDVANASKVGYSVSFVSENRIWYVGIKPVIFGYRVVAWRKDSIGCSVDYCAGGDTAFLVKLVQAVLVLFQHFPESVSELEVADFMPSYKTRPINTDPCWGKICEIVDQLPAFMIESDGSIRDRSNL